MQLIWNIVIWPLTLYGCCTKPAFCDWLHDTFPNLWKFVQSVTNILPLYSTLVSELSVWSKFMISTQSLSIPSKLWLIIDFSSYLKSHLTFVDKERIAIWGWVSSMDINWFSFVTMHAPWLESLWGPITSVRRLIMCNLNAEICFLLQYNAAMFGFCISIVSWEWKQLQIISKWINRKFDRSHMSLLLNST